MCVKSVALLLESRTVAIAPVVCTPGFEIAGGYPSLESARVAVGHKIGEAHDLPRRPIL